MNKFQKICLALSCFLLLYVILMLKNILKIYELINVENFNWKTFDFIFNISLVGIWLLCILGSVGAIVMFKRNFLQAYNKSAENIVIEDAENITSEYYFTYFSLFVLTFFTVDPTQWVDILILFLLILFIIWVYIINDMWFINPVLNVIGFKSFKITYKKYDLENKLFEVHVFSKDNLNKEINEEYKISYSLHDFSICYSKKDK